MSTLILSSPRFTPAWRDGAIVAAVLLAHAALLASLNATRPTPPEPPTPLTVQLLTPAPLQAAPQPEPVAAPEPAKPPVAKPLPRPESRPQPKPAPQPVSNKPAPNPLPRMTAAAAPTQPSPAAESTAPAAKPAPATNTSPGPSSQDKAPAEVVLPSTRASYLHNPKPPYPPASKRNGDTGTVLLRVMVDAKGNAQDVTLRQSSGYPELDQSALETVRRWRFVPGKRNGEATAMAVTVPIAFRLNR